MRTAGLVLDFYDDSKGELLKQAFPTIDELPEIVKEAHILIPEEREVLRDEAYALILHNEGRQLRKFACVDAGNTFLSALYFVENKDKLPEEAQKVAAANILAAAEEYGLTDILDPLIKEAAGLVPVPAAPVSREYVKREQSKGGRVINRISDALQPVKMSAAIMDAPQSTGMTYKWNGVEYVEPEPLSQKKPVSRPPPKAGKATKASKTGKSRIRDSFQQPHVGDEADWAQRTNILSVRGGADSGKVVPTANQMKTAGIPSYLKKMTKKEFGITKVKKWPKDGRLAARIQQWQHGKQDATHFKGLDELDKSMRRYRVKNAPADSTLGAWKDVRKELKKESALVDVSNLEAPIIMKNKTASCYALGNKYALDSYTDVQRAIHYFDENWVSMAPEDRHEFAVKTASRADELGIPISMVMDRYGSTEYAPDLDAHIANRVQHSNKEDAKLYRELQEKTASVSPDEFVKLLSEADDKTGLCYEYGNSVCDAYMATYGGRGIEKKASWSWEDGDTSMTEVDLKGINRETMLKVFNEDVVEAFNKDPVQIFDSMPREQKLIIAKMVG